MAQKIIKIGSSAGVTLSPETLDSVKLRVSDPVDVTVHPQSRTITIRPRHAQMTADLDVVTWTNSFIEKNRTLLERLADK